jgi:hypothetical protein
MKIFENKDVKTYNEPGANAYEYIDCQKSDLIFNPPEWMIQGLHETASGYGKRLNSGYSINFEGRIYRIYVTQFSNLGTSWFKIKGRQIIVH